MINGKRNLIFVGGVHGVGKTWICEKLSTKLELDYLSAGDVIRRANSAANTVRKEVADVNENQAALIQALDAIISSGRSYLMDGHFCLLHESGGIVNIPDTVYQAIAPKAIIIVQDNPVNILSRLHNRDNKKYSLTLISEMQERELQQSQRLSRLLGIPIQTYNTMTSWESLTDFIKSHSAKTA